MQSTHQSTYFPVYPCLWYLKKNAQITYQTTCVVYPGKNKQEDHDPHSSLANDQLTTKQQTISCLERIRN